VRGGGEQNEVACGRFGEPLEQLVALVSALASGGTGVRFITDHKARAGVQKEVSPRFALDVVEADDRVWKGR